ncbi:hypothetical protein F5X68DRAFT_225559 [Plectosphaerella plurivora]|uniref:Rhodopsin domain-containing protein n=1 Tax=Plectosphaerella plurivora TaxID=936078 RepID=A0A9P8V1U5_9PEZI|nr:hypothetical protein F5X68DRAFT_225559 [Plectosphaerella plurivora]
MSLPPPPADLDLTESRVPEILGSLATTWTFAVIAVGLRFLARRLKNNPLWIEDFLVAASLVFASIHVWTSIGFMVPHGTGKHVWVGPPEAVKVWAIGLFISEITYTLNLATVKFSTLAFYWRIFGSNSSIHIPIWTLFGIVSAWGIAVLGVSIFQCWPIHAFWQQYDPINPMSPTDFTCGVNLNQFFNGNSIPNIITDALVVMLPIPYVWKLQLPGPQKFAVIFIFALGAFVTIISAVRLVFILRVDLASPDITWNFCDAIIWTNAEGNLAIVCCCLPSLKPLLSLALKGTVGTTDDNTAKSGASNTFHQNSKPARSHQRNSAMPIASKGLSKIDDERPFARLDERDSNSFNDTASGHELTDLGKDGITVTKAFKIDSNVDQRQ